MKKENQEPAISAESEGTSSKGRRSTPRKKGSAGKEISSAEQSADGNGRSRQTANSTKEIGRLEEQARQVSREVPVADDVQFEDSGLGGRSKRGFAETDSEERSDTPRRVGRRPHQDTGAEEDQAEVDEDGGGPRQSATLSDGMMTESPEEDESDLHVVRPGRTENDADKDERNKPVTSVQDDERAPRKSSESANGAGKRGRPKTGQTKTGAKRGLPP